MKILNLIENTEGPAHCPAEHGLCFYIETEKHRLLMDTGATELFAENAKRLGVDLTSVDTVVLSHGHYDHGGGLPLFLKLNDKAKVYLQESAFGAYYGIDSPDEEPRYIGLADGLEDSGRIVKAGRELRIDSELYIFSEIGSELPSPDGNKALHVQTEEGMIRDDFRHEQCLAVTQGQTTILFSGCAHHGILNVLAKFRQLFGNDPDVVISGFHMMRKNGYSEEDLRAVADTAYELQKYSKTKFYTCHCTGAEPYKVMKEIMKDQLEYVQCGDEVRVEIQ